MAKKVGNANWLFFSQLADVYCYLPSGELSNVRAETLSSIDSPFFAFRITRILAYSILGNLCLIEGDMGQAEDWLLKALVEYNEFPFQEGAGSTFFPYFLDCPLGRLFMCNGDFDRAEKYLANGYSLIKKRGLYVDDAQAMANTLSLLATVCERQGKRMEAIHI